MRQMSPAKGRLVHTNKSPWGTSLSTLTGGRREKKHIDIIEDAAVFLELEHHTALSSTQKWWPFLAS